MSDATRAERLAAAERCNGWKNISGDCVRTGDREDGEQCARCQREIADLRLIARLEAALVSTAAAVRKVYPEDQRLIAEQARQIDEARKLAEEACAKYNGLLEDQRILRCAFCDAEYPPGTPATQHQLLTDHVRVCEKHPLRAQIEAALVALEPTRECNGCGGCCCYIPDALAALAPKKKAAAPELGNPESGGDDGQGA